MSTIRTVALSATIASLASVPAVQIAQQQGIIKFAGDVTIREPLNVASLPPIDFQFAAPEYVELDDSDGAYSVPQGKRLVLIEAIRSVGQNATHPSYSPQTGSTNLPFLRVVSDPAGKIDPGSYITISSIFMLGGISTVPQVVSFGPGTVIEVRDNGNANDVTNAGVDRVVCGFRLVDA